MLAVLSRLASAAPPAPDEPPAFQVLRRSFASSPAAISRVADLPALGPGQPLGPAIRRPLERWLGRELGRVRAHTSTLPTELGALAFTTGQHIVFAPGRLTRQGVPNWPLLSHELSHLDRTLAFRLAGKPAESVDEEERIALAREAAVARLAAEGWPDTPPLDYRRAPATQGTDRGDTRPTTNIGRGLLPEAISATQRGTIARSSEPLPAARVHEIDPVAKPAPTPDGHDVNALARQVYGLLTRRLRAEWDRHQVYG